MSRRRDRRAAARLPHVSTTDPRTLGGAVAGPGGPFDRGGVVVESTNAILVDSLTVAAIDDPDQDAGVYALLFGGRVNHSTDHADVMLLGDLDLLAHVVAEVMALTERAGQHVELLSRVSTRLDAMPKTPTPKD